jgi:hypothetical protein
VKLTTHLHLVPRSNTTWRYTFTHQYAFLAWCLVKHRDNFTFTFYGSIFGYLVGFLGQGISLSQGHYYLRRTAQHRKTRTHIHASSGIRTTISVFERSKSVRASDRAAIGTGVIIKYIFHLVCLYKTAHTEYYFEKLFPGVLGAG